MKHIFDYIRNYFRTVVSKINKGNLASKVGVKSIAIDKSVGLWTAMYQDNAPWLLEDENLKTLSLPASISSELAKLTTLEFKSKITSKSNTPSKRITLLNDSYQNLISDIRRQTEYACAKGGIVFKPYFNGENIEIDCVHADEFEVVRFNSSGKIVECIFPDHRKIGDRYFIRIEHHNITSEGIVIKNKAFSSDESKGIRSEVSLDVVEDWKDISEEVLIVGENRPLYGYFRIPLANNKDIKSEMGVSVFSRAVSLIKDADEQYSRFMWEFEGGELALDVDPAAINGSELPKGKKRLFRKLDISPSDKGELYEPFNPTLRDNSYFNGLNRILQRIEFSCGLAYGTLSDVQETAKTAAEIHASKQRSYATVSDIQKALQTSLEDLVYAMNILCDSIGIENDDYSVSFEFDDSLIVDSGADQAIMMQEVAAGLIKPEIYLMRRYGLTKEQCKEWVPTPKMDSDFEEEE